MVNSPVDSSKSVDTLLYAFSIGLFWSPTNVPGAAVVDRKFRK